eukprot:776697-Prymnesium_polylepis.3
MPASSQMHQHHAHYDSGPGGHVAAIVAASLQLVKVFLRGDGPFAQLAPRPTIAFGAVAIAVASGLGPASAGAPATARLAHQSLQRCGRVTPVAPYETELRDRRVRLASDARDGAAWRAFARRGTGVRAIVARRTE